MTIATRTTHDVRGSNLREVSPDATETDKKATGPLVAITYGFDPLMGDD